MKIIKIILRVLLVLIALALALVLTLPLWIGAVVPPVARSVVPKITGTGFDLGGFGFSPYNGRLSVENAKLRNPAGFAQTEAFALGRLFVDVDMASLATDTIVIEEVLVKDLSVVYAMNASGQSNFGLIAEHAQGGAKKTEPANAKPAETAKPAQADKPKAKDDKPARKVIIDRLRIEGVTVAIGPIPMPLPAITLEGIGRKSGGVTFAEAWEQIVRQVSEKAGLVGDSFKMLQSGLDKGLDGALESAASKATMKALGVSAEATKKAFGTSAEATTRAVGGSMDATTKVIGGSVDATTKAVGAGADATKKAVGDSVDAAAKALKGLFK